MRPLGTTLTLLAVTLLLSSSGCAQDPFTLTLTDGGTGGDQLGGGDGFLPGNDGQGSRTDGIKRDGACVKDPKGEVCNGKDDDCNGKVDDVPASALASDAKNCGQCGNVCSFLNAFAKCDNGTCVMQACAPGYYDINGKPGDGCEYACVKSNGGIEICDNADNDCDGTPDNGFDLQTDTANCGACGDACVFKDATPACVKGQCTMGACTTGFKDINKSASDGCEYQCPIWPPKTTDPCDGVDNDCDGQVDEDFQPAPCGTAGVGECKQGTTQCVGGISVCQGGVSPKPETCNGKDDDCDGAVDNGFDKQNDPRFCGNCTPCNLPHAIAKCVGGTCAIAVCQVGWVDLNKSPSDGCEYNCTVTGVEICDGLDNDCDGLVDTADSSFVPLSGNPCSTLGACAGATATCQGSSGWGCNYGPDVERKTCITSADCGFGACSGGLCANVLAYDETRCDGKDNDCDGLTDEPFPDKGKPCGDPGKLGICQGTGTWICNGAGNGTVCNITTLAQPATDEKCNGLDDDCDGLVDEEADDAAGKGVVDAMVQVTNFYIYTYEASRPDAKSDAAGSNSTRACSKGGFMPWANVTYAEAKAACTAAGPGKHLCTAAEWLAACQVAGSLAYPYGNTYQAQTCNGADHGVWTPVATGTMSDCKGGGIYDMSGNLKEWSDELKDNGGFSGYTVRGGAYDNVDVGLRCDFTFAVMPPAFHFPNLGFRCCSSNPP